jgi:hypothetical protein
VKAVAFVILTLLCAQVSARQPPSHAPHSKQKICWVGTTGYDLKANEECINTVAKCRAKHGIWGGTVAGRGRRPGCTLPTKDAGKTCSNSSQCEGYCEAHVSKPNACTCSASSRMPKGTPPFGLCTPQGIQWIQID